MEEEKQTENWGHVEELTSSYMLALQNVLQHSVIILSTLEEGFRKNSLGLAENPGPIPLQIAFFHPKWV